MKLLLILLFSFTISSAFPSDQLSFILQPQNGSRSHRIKRQVSPGTIEKMTIDTVVVNRYAKTTVTSKVKNSNNFAQAVMFQAIISANAYISGFTMEIDGKVYNASVKSKNEAQNAYDQAVSSGQTAAHVEMSARHANRFTVSVNVEAEKIITFQLTYEEMLVRKNNRYDVVINVSPGSPVKDLLMKVSVNETLPLKFIGTAPIRRGNDNEPLLYLYDSQITVIDEKTAEVTISLDEESHRQLSIFPDSDDYMGIKFTVQYDLERNAQSEPVMVSGDYFVQFFAPTLSDPLPKQVIFVLDVSGSMDGRKINKLRSAMSNILTKLKSNDIFNVVEFSDEFKIWDISELEKYSYSEEECGEKLESRYVPRDAQATKSNIRNAIDMVNNIESNGLTNIYGALENALYLTSRSNDDKNFFQPIIIFLTDGLPNSGITTHQEIVEKVTDSNAGFNRAAIFSLSFGEDANKEMLEQLSLMNLGTYRHIYDEADADIQLQEFYNEIAAPMLKELSFEYGHNTVDEVTKTEFPMYFYGSEIVVAGKLTAGGDFIPVVKARNKRNVTQEFHPGMQNCVADLRRLFVYLTLKQQIDCMKIAPNASAIAEQVTSTALEYSFVTPLTSLVVVKPDKTESLAKIEDAFIEKTTITTTTPQSFQPGPGFSADFNNMGTYYSFSNMMSIDSMWDTPVIPPEIKTPMQQLKEDLPWLENIMDDDDTIFIGEASYKVQVMQVGWNIVCMNSINNSSGHCQSLFDCQQISKVVFSAEKYYEYFCPLNDVAGICCSSSES